MLLEIDGLRILIDPVWDQRASPVEWSGPKRFFAPPLALEHLPRIDALLLSHDHYDHLGANTVRQLARMQSLASATWITTLGVGARLLSLGVKPEVIRELNWTNSTTVGPITLTALPARHFSGRESSTVSKRSGPRLSLPAQPIASITEPTPESGKASQKSEMSSAPST